MNKKQTGYKVGPDDIKNILNRTLSNIDFSSINREIRGTVDMALVEAEKAISKTGFTIESLKRRSNYRYPVNVANKPQQFISSTVKKYAAIFGITVATAISIAGLITLFDDLFGNLILLGVFLVIDIFFFAVFRKANFRIGLYKRFNKYMTVLRRNGVGYTRELSAVVQKPVDFVVKDLGYMVEHGIFPQGHIVEDGTIFILEDEIYRFYAENKMKEPIEEPEEMSEELKKIISDGESYARQIRAANDLIPGEEISRKLSSLELVIGEIIKSVERHPEQLPALNKFSSYYMPTTLKLVEAYKNLDMNEVEGPSSKAAKEEIERTMDTIILAYERLLEKLMKEKKMDVSSDISTLKAMLAQEGLTDEDPFNLHK